MTNILRKSNCIQKYTKYGFLLIFIMFCFIHLNTYAEQSKKVLISFNINDFKLSYDDKNILYIGSDVHCADYGTDFTAPGLPLISINVIIPKGYSYRNISIQQDKRLFQKNVIVAPTPFAIPTSAAPIATPRVATNYKERWYPASPIKYVNTNRFGENNVVCFLVSPFEYNTKSKSLYFTDEFALDVQLYQNTTRATDSQISNCGLEDIVKSITINPEDIENKQTQPKEIETNLEPIDYIIITTSALKEAFKPLTKWKRTKGVRADIATIEDINRLYQGNSIPFKIKTHIKNLHDNNGLKYVLLGGDDTIVPVQGCYGSVKLSNSNITDKTIPTDLFYACLSGNLNWDGDGDGIYGETTDNIDLSPSVFVTRLPVRTATHTNAVVNKIINYEKTPTEYGWNNNILMTGRKISYSGDAEEKGQIIYSQYITPYWNGNRTRFYDTATDFSEGATYDVTAANIQDQLSLGYTFVDMITHGSQTEWLTEKGELYSSTHGNSLTNYIPTIITTNACSTNAFDSSSRTGTQDPCLSESLIRNANNGVVSYLGCSREGWDTSFRGMIGTSLLYEAQFYKALFSSTIKDKNHGVIVAAAKAAMAGHCSSDGGNRWVQFGLNPIGDPEMPIFVNTPLSFSNVSVKKNETEIIVNTGVSDCTICAMDANGGNYYSVVRNVENTTFTNTPTEISICITKQGYIPKIIKVLGNAFIQNEIVYGPKKINADIVRIGSNVTHLKPTGTATIGSGQVVITANKIKIEDGTTINKDANLIINNK